MVTTGSAQPDISVPGYATIDTWVPDSGLPMSEMWVEIGDEDGAIPMPPGPAGRQGEPGQPRATFVKMGTLANEAARPAILGPGARGCWWHRLDTNGMDVWTGTEWKHSPNAVGVTGPVAKNNTLDVLPTLRDETYTIAALELKGRKADTQTAQFTVPAGRRGDRGPTGNIFGTPITEAPDYDPLYGPVDGSMFAYSRITRRFRSLSRPANGYGPFHYGANSFSGPTTLGSPQDLVYYFGNRIVATLDIPPMPFAWRPMVWGQYRTCVLPGTLVNPKPSPLHMTARLNQLDGPKVADGINPFRQGKFDFDIDNYPGINTHFGPFFGDSQPVRIRDGGGGYGTVPAYEPASILICIELIVNGQNNAYVYEKTGAWACVWVNPVKANSGIAERKIDVNTAPDEETY